MNKPETTNKYLEKYGQFFIDMWAKMPRQTEMDDAFEWMKKIYEKGKRDGTRI